MIKRIFKINFLVFLGLVLFILFLDYLTTNINGYRGFAKFFISNSSSGYINRPNFSGIYGGYLDEFSSLVEIGNLGERVSSYDKSCKYQESIIFLGDSSTVGFELENVDTFVSNFNNIQCKYKNYNFGVRGYNTHNVIGKYKLIKNKISHSKVVYIFNSNDLTDNLNISRYSNMYNYFGNVYDQKFIKPKIDNFQKIYYEFGIFFSDNFYFFSKIFKKIRYHLILKKKFYQDTQTNTNSLKKEEIIKFVELIYKLDELTKEMNVKLYLMGHPCEKNVNCKSIQMENVLINNNYNFNILPLANIIKKKINQNIINKEKIIFKIDGHGTEYLHEIISNELKLYFLNS